MRHRCAEGFLSILHAQGFGAAGFKKMEFLNRFVGAVVLFGDGCGKSCQAKGAGN